MSTSSRQTGRASAWATPAAVWGFLTLVAVSTTQSEYAAGDLTALAALYAVLAAALTAAARLLGGLGLAGRVGGAGLVGLVLAWTCASKPTSKEPARRCGRSRASWRFSPPP